MLQWGPASGGADDLSTYLTIGGVPVKMWVTAEVKVPWFFKTNGSIQKRAAICFVPLRDCDAERGLLMSTAYCKPQAGASLSVISLDIIVHFCSQILPTRRACGHPSGSPPRTPPSKK